MPGSISHLLWLTGLCAALATLLTVLSTASYRFIWATTLLAPDTFVWLTQAIGWLPGVAGFPPPDAATVLASDGVQTLPAAAQVQWSLWLIGVVVVYGVLPRLAAALLCLVVLRRRLAGLRIDPALPGHAALRDRLEPAVVSTGLDRPVDPLHEPRLSAPAPAGLDGRPVLLALELPNDLPWPPATTPAGIQIAGRLDTREERRRILDALADAAASRLLIACDARQTPDRGTLTLIAELAAHAQQTRVWLLLPAHEDGPARARCGARSSALGLPAQAVLAASANALDWLETGHG